MACVVGGHVWQGACVAGGVHGGRASMAGGCVWQRDVWWEGMHGRGCASGGHAWQGEGPCVVGETATAADSTHPT